MDLARLTGDNAAVTDLAAVAPAFVEMAHRIVWCTVATVDSAGHPRTRILHPIWEWDGTSLVGWIGTGGGSLKTKHLARVPHVSLTYWTTNHDTCSAEAAVTLHEDDETCVRVWNAYKDAPDPVGYDPAIIPVWADGPTSPAFVVMRLEPSRLFVQPQMDFTRAVRWSR